MGGAEHRGEPGDPRRPARGAPTGIPRRIRRTRRALGMSTEASYRFERGIDRWGGGDAMRRCIELVLATGGRPAGRRPARPLARAVAPAAHLPPPRARGPGARRRAALARDRAVPGRHRRHGGLASRTTAGSRWTCPAGGPTCVREIDLIEEIARLHGYDNFPSDLRPFRVGHAARRARGEGHLRGPPRPGGRRVSTRSHASRWARPMATTASACSTRSPPTMPGSAGGCCPGSCAWWRRNWANHVADVRLFEIGTAFAAGAPGRAPAGGAPGRRRADRPPRAARTGPAPAQARFDLWDLKGRLRGRGRSGDSRRARCKLKGNAWVARDAEGRIVGEAGPLAADAPPWAAPLFGFELRARPGAPPAAPVHAAAHDTRVGAGARACSCRRG